MLANAQTRCAHGCIPAIEPGLYRPGHDCEWPRSGFRVRRRCDAPPAHIDAVERQLATGSLVLGDAPRQIAATADNRTMNEYRLGVA